MFTIDEGCYIQVGIIRSLAIRKGGKIFGAKFSRVCMCVYVFLSLGSVTNRSHFSLLFLFFSFLSLRWLLLSHVTPRRKK